MKKILTILIMLFALNGIAQQSDSQLAFEYYSKREYGKAAELFLQLYERTRSSQYLDFYIIALINNKDYDKAEENLLKYLKTTPDNKDFLINLGYIFITSKG